MTGPLIGNERINESVLCAIKENRLPHAVIIEGEKGTGRHTLAAFLTRAFLCFGEERPCGACESCRLAGAGSHPDIYIAAPEDGKKNITVAQIRSLRNEAYVKPHIANGRAFIIDMADTMNEQSQNALLKVLEEPPGNTLFLLIAESKAALLDTVISRCTVLSLGVPEIDAAEEYIKAVYKFPPEQIKAALSETNGNIGAALETLNGGGEKAVSAADDFIRYFLSGEDVEMLKITAAFEKNRVAAAAFLKEVKLCAAKSLKENRRNLLTAKSLAAFYDEISGFEESLNTNINLSLLFCALVCKAAELNK